MAYDQELNDLIDENRIGIEIKKAFNRTRKNAVYLQKVATDAIAPDGEFTSPAVQLFTEENQAKMKEFINAIDAVTTTFIDDLDLINNPEDTE